MVYFIKRTEINCCQQAGMAEVHPRFVKRQKQQEKSDNNEKRRLKENLELIDIIYQKYLSSILLFAHPGIFILQLVFYHVLDLRRRYIEETMLNNLIHLGSPNDGRYCHLSDYKGASLSITSSLKNYYHGSIFLVLSFKT